MANLTTEHVQPRPTLSDKMRQLASVPLKHLARVFIRAGINANLITLVGAFIAFIPAVLAAQGRFTAAGLVYLLCVPLDVLDGAVAREGGQATRFGALLDSTLDRYSEAIMMSGIAYYMAHSGNEAGVVLAFAALFGSLMVSYTRARSEGLTVDNKVGIMTRFERTALTILGLLTGYVMVLLWVLAVLTQFTVVQRIWRVYRATKNDGA
jgi:CDP-diacylglycerol---glycerol-3-phosphate 3-phosphatidyltransferase